MENISSLGSLDCLGNGGGSLLPKSFRTSFSAPLKNTLVLQRGYDGATFSRDTTATVTDFEGLVKKVKSGEARFEGARRVENLFTYSEDFSNSSWTSGLTAGGTGSTPTLTPNYGTAPDGTLTAARLVCNLNGGNTANDKSWLQKTGLSSAPNSNKVVSIWVKTTDGTTKNLALRAGGLTNIISASETWKRYSVLDTLTNADPTSYIGLRGASSTSDSADILIWHPQGESVVGQANQNPSEYVSTNVLASAPYHGANVDGVKYFTTQNGNTVASNVVTEATGAAIADATLHGYVAEGARTNYVLQSGTPSNAAWAKRGTATSVTGAADPFGGTNGETVTVGAIATNDLFQVVSTFPVSTTLAMGIWIKRVTTSGTLSVQTPSVTGGATGSWSINLALLPDAYVYLTASHPAVTVNTAYVSGSTGNNGVWFYCTAGCSFIFGGAQLEAGAFASSYIPTTTASVTRNADSLLYLIANNFLDAKGTIYLEAKYESNYLDSGTLACLIDNSFSSSNNRFQIRSSGAPGVGTMTALFGNGSAILVSTGKQVTTNLIKIAARWSTSSAVLFEDGTKYSTVGATAIVSGTYLKVGLPTTGQEAFATIRNIKIWKKELSDSKIISLTT